MRNLRAHTFSIQETKWKVYKAIRESDGLAGGSMSCPKDSGMDKEDTVIR